MRAGPAATSIDEAAAAGSQLARARGRNPSVYVNLRDVVAVFPAAPFVKRGGKGKGVKRVEG